MPFADCNCPECEAGRAEIRIEEERQLSLIDVSEGVQYSVYDRVRVWAVVKSNGIVVRPLLSTEDPYDCSTTYSVKSVMAKIAFLGSQLDNGYQEVILQWDIGSDIQLFAGRGRTVNGFYQGRDYRYSTTSTSQIVGVVASDVNDDEFVCSSCEDTFVELECCQLCENCCEHFICEECSSHEDDGCADCNHCSDHCECTRCSRCSEVHPDWNCEECDRCEECCDGHSEDEDDVGTPCTKHYDALHPRDRKLFNSARKAGVEWEYNHVLDSERLLGQWKKNWKGDIHHDGSCGREAVSPPAAGDFLIKTIRELGKALEDSKASIDGTCSVHVHVDATDYQWADMYRLLKIYSYVEPALYLLAGQNRLGNSYCRPCGSDYKKALNQVDRKGAILSTAFDFNDNLSGLYERARKHQQGCPEKKEGGRYRGLNLMPWIAGRRNKASDTTVEFRIHRDTDNTERVVGWAKLCVRLVEWASKASQKDLETLPRSPMRALTHVVAPDCAPWILNRIKAWRKDTNNQSRKIHLRDGQYQY